MKREARDYAEDTDPQTLNFRGMIRRVAISLTAKALWQFIGFRLPDGTQETRTVEPFTGIGHYARPPNSGTPEAIVVMVGDAKNPMIIAVRDEKTRSAIAGAIAQDETMLFNSQSVVYIKADGSIEVRSSTGTAVALATLADLQALIDIFVNWTPVPMDGGAALKAAITAYISAHSTWPVGTKKLKGE